MLEMDEQYMMRRPYEEGLSITEISRKTGYIRKTVRKYILKRKNKRISEPDPYKDYINARLIQYNLSTVRIMEEIQEMGCI